LQQQYAMARLLNTHRTVQSHTDITQLHQHYTVSLV
jgi:hypothetical protein